MQTYLHRIKRLLVCSLHLCKVSLYSLYLRFQLAPLLHLSHLCLVAIFTQVFMLTLSKNDLTPIKLLYIVIYTKKQAYWHILEIEPLQCADLRNWNFLHIKEHEFKFCHCSVPIYQAICMVTDINVIWQWWLKNNMSLLNSTRYLNISQYNSLDFC